MKKQSASILNSLKRFNSDRKIAGKHPLRQLIPERPGGWKNSAIEIF